MATLVFKFWTYVASLVRGFPHQKSLSLHSLLRCALFTPLITVGIAYGALPESNVRMFSQHPEVLLTGVNLALLIIYKTIKVLYYNYTAPTPPESLASRAIDLLLMAVFTPLVTAAILNLLEQAGLPRSTFEIVACTIIPVVYAIGLLGLAVLHLLASGFSAVPAPAATPYVHPR